MWAYGNGLRKAKGLSELRLDDYLRSPDTIEFLLAVEKRYGTGISKYGDSPCLENPTNTYDSEIIPKQDLTIEYNRKTGLAKVVGGELSIIKTKRAKFEEKLIILLEMDVVRDWNHLKELIHRL